ncbi:DICT sensory domain-containing protein [Natrialbaceae archaeon A-gly3]
MSFEDFLSTVDDRRKTIIVYSSREDPDDLEGLATRNATVEYRRLPGDADGFAVVRDEEGFLGSISLEELRKLLEPPLYRPQNLEDLSPGYRELYDILAETLFSSLDRRQLLAAAREIENRAWRVGHGTLRVGFQRVSAMEAQVPVYATFASETDLEIHVYGRDDWTVPEIPGVTVHDLEAGSEATDYWFLTFDGGTGDEQACALLAEERDPGEYAGFWTYDRDLVAKLAGYVRKTVG